MAAYEGLARVYDALMDDVDYDAWAAYYLSLIARKGCAPKRLCDCGCGTGALSVRFAERGLGVIGVDLSESMLETAQESARRRGVHVMFVRQDMRNLALPRPVDALICGCDGVNYLLDEDSLKAFFRAAHESIRPGGALAFDISTRYKLSNVLGNNFFGEVRDEVAYLWNSRYDEAADLATMDVTFFRREYDGRYRRFDELHTQRAHDPEALCEHLSRAGFEEIEIFGDQVLDAPSEDALRIHFAAIRA